MDKEIKLKALRKIVLKSLGDEFEPSVEFLVNSLSNFETTLSNKLTTDLKALEDKSDEKAIMSALLGTLELQKTVGNSIAKGVVIVISAFLKQTIRNCNLTEEVAFDGGPSIEGKNWALAVTTISNYIRHRDEWDMPSRNPFKVGEKWVAKKVKNVISKLPTPKARANAEIIRSLGFKPDQFVGPSKDISYDLAIKCNLQNLEQTVINYKQWINYLESKM